jgi:hypothetical protein
LFGARRPENTKEMPEERQEQEGMNEGQPPYGGINLLKSAMKIQLINFKGLKSSHGGRVDLGGKNGICLLGVADGPLLTSL